MKVLKRLVKIKGNLFIDIGACYGSYSYSLSKNFSRVVAFEPDEHNFKVLRLVGRLLRKRNVKCLKMAVSDRDGVIKLFIAKSIFEHTIKHDHTTSTERFTVVKAISLDSFVKGTVDLIKVDVQYAAFDVLRGSLSVIREIKRWLIELESGELELKWELEKLLRSLGYNTQWVSDQHIYAWKTN